MPSNADLKAQIAEINPGIEVPEDATNADLTKILKEVKAVAAAASQPDETPKVEASGSSHVVAEGKSIMTKHKGVKGIFGPGRDICVDDVSGGAKAFENLVDKKFIVAK